MTAPPAGGFVVSHGVDVAEVARVTRSIERHGERFLDRVFTPDERAYCGANKRAPEHFAARFAAKEAVFKALGTGWAQGVSWREIEVTRAPSGAPGVRLTGRAAAEIASELGISAWLLSLSHTGSIAIASAIALCPERATEHPTGRPTGRPAERER
ncbi:MAG: holo-ACP synthase [Planctomycetota bacterium]